MIRIRRKKNKKAFAFAVAFAVAAEMGFEAGDVVWVRSSFDEAIQPGAKNFDVNMQQYSITPERDAVVDFSAPYFTAPMAVLVSANATETATAIANTSANAPVATSATTNATATAKQPPTSRKPTTYRTRRCAPLKGRSTR